MKKIFLAFLLTLLLAFALPVSNALATTEEEVCIELTENSYEFVVGDDIYVLEDWTIVPSTFGPVPACEGFVYLTYPDGSSHKMTWLISYNSGNTINMAGFNTWFKATLTDKGLVVYLIPTGTDSLSFGGKVYKIEKDLDVTLTPIGNAVYITKENIPSLLFE